MFAVDAEGCFDLCTIKTNFRNHAQSGCTTALVRFLECKVKIMEPNLIALISCVCVKTPLSLGWLFCLTSSDTILQYNVLDKMVSPNFHVFQLYYLNARGSS